MMWAERQYIMKYSIKLAVKSDYDKIVGLYEKAFEHREGLVAKYYTGFNEYLVSAD